MYISHNIFLDNVIIICDRVLKIIISELDTTVEEMPGDNLKEVVLTVDEHLLSTRLMRVNHSGEISAQALYQGQSLMAKTLEIKQVMEKYALRRRIICYGVNNVCITLVVVRVYLIRYGILVHSR